MVDKVSYTIDRTEISLSSGIKVVAEVSSVDGIKDLLKDLKTAGLGEFVAVGAELNVSRVDTSLDELDEPARRIETQSGLDSGRLVGAKILAIKDGVPQILQKSLFSSVTDAILVLMYALEVGLKQNPVNYQDFSSLFESQNLKSGSPLAMLITNLRNAGYLDNRVYADGRKLRLSAKGEAKAVEVLKRLATASHSA